MKLWQKESKIDREIEKFTVGDDYILDKKLLIYDIYGSVAHAKMLKKIGILTELEYSKLKDGFLGILKLNSAGNFKIKLEDEDCHTAIENYLTKKLGKLGEKIHTARSRNDQVLTAIRLYSKVQLFEIIIKSISLAKTLLEFAFKNKSIPIPGYTHSRKAMPSSVGLLFGSYAESIIDNITLLQVAIDQNNQSPLGSASGFGINLPIDRNMTAELLGFSKVQNNVLYIQNSRGKVESIILFALSKIMDDLSKISNDLTIYTMDEFGFFSLPDNMTTGSSLMPNKKNPDILELIRAKSSSVRSRQIEIDLICQKLLSGYNRDFQLTKGPLMVGLEVSLSSIIIMRQVIENLEVNKQICIDSLDKEIFATDEAIESVRNGTPFRSAYRKLGKNLNQIKVHNPIENINLKTHIGASGNLGIDTSLTKIKKIKSRIDKEKINFIKKLNLLISEDETSE
jgi:argininosuccinate lyase